MDKKSRLENSTDDSKGVQRDDGRRIKRPNYKRHPKPPYSYLGLAVMAIELSDSKMLTLSGVQKEVKKMFPFFTGEYEGWKDSIKHNISSNSCFVKLDCCGNIVVKGKSKYWAVDLSLVPPNAFKRQETKVSRESEWALYLQDELGVPPLLEPGGMKTDSSRRPLMTPSTLKLSDTASVMDADSEISDTILPEIGENFEIVKESKWNMTIKEKYHSSVFANSTKTFSNIDTGQSKRQYPYSKTETPLNIDCDLSKRQQPYSKSEMPSNIDAVVKLLTTSIRKEEQNMDTKIAVDNLKLLCQNFDSNQSSQTDYRNFETNQSRQTDYQIFEACQSLQTNYQNFDINQSRQIGYYCVANPMACQPRSSCYDGLSNQTYPYYVSSGNWWDPSVSVSNNLSNYYYYTASNKNYQFCFSPYSQCILPSRCQNQTDHSSGVVLASGLCETSASSSIMLLKTDRNTSCEVASSVVPRDSSPLTSDNYDLFQADTSIGAPFSQQYPELVVQPNTCNDALSPVLGSPPKP